MAWSRLRAKAGVGNKAIQYQVCPDKLWFTHGATSRDCAAGPPKTLGISQSPRASGFIAVVACEVRLMAGNWRARGDKAKAPPARRGSLALGCTQGNRPRGCGAYPRCDVRQRDPDKRAIPASPLRWEAGMAAAQYARASLVNALIVNVKPTVSLVLAGLTYAHRPGSGSHRPVYRAVRPSRTCVDRRSSDLCVPSSGPT